MEVGEAKALSLGISLYSIYDTLQSSTMGALYVKVFNMVGRSYRVQLQAEPEYRMKPQDIDHDLHGFHAGVLPSAISTGVGEAVRQSIGAGVLGGMLAATFIATLFVPVFF